MGERSVGPLRQHEQRLAAGLLFDHRVAALRERDDRTLRDAHVAAHHARLFARRELCQARRLDRIAGRFLGARRGRERGEQTA